MKKLILAAALALIPLRGMAVTTTKTFAKQAVDTSWTLDLQQLGVNSLSAGTVNIAGSGQLLTGNASSTSLATLVPGQAKGALITNSTTGELCTSTATVAGSWVLVRALATACY
jgi:hypothetical protein